MASLDPYLKFAIQNNARQLILRPSQKPVLVTPKGPVAFGQPIHATQIKIAIGEIIPADQRDAFGKTGNAKATYSAEGKHFQIVTQLTGAGVEAVFTDMDAKRDSREMPAEAPEPRKHPTPPQGNAAMHAPAPDHKPVPIDVYLQKMVQIGASDLHLCSGRTPKYRVDGDLGEGPDPKRLSQAELQALLDDVTPESELPVFERDGSCDFAYGISGVGRYRFNIFREQDGISASIRLIPSKVLSADDLGLPKALRKLARLPKGLVLVTGPTGSGKSTTLAAIVDLVNLTRADHIITIESPIEFVHRDKKCLVHQREVGRDTAGFKVALRDAMREDPDVVLVGEMRDLETISTAIETAATGHLVFGTLHTTTAPQTVNRIIEIFPAEQQSQVRHGLAESLKAVVAQNLLKKKGGGRVAAQEVLLITPSVSNLIREQKTHQLLNVMQTSRGMGMQLLNEELLRLVKEDIVEPEEAYQKAVDKDDLLRMYNINNIAYKPSEDADF